MNGDDTLLRLVESTAEAVTGVLTAFAPDAVGEVATAVMHEAGSALDGFQAPAVVSSVAYVNGVTGGNVFVLTTAGARRLAAAMMGEDPSHTDGGPVDEMTLSAVAEATNQMMAAAASATSEVLGQEIEISPPETRLVDTIDRALDGHGQAPHAVSVSFELHGEPCRLVQLVPTAFAVRMTRALDDLSTIPAPPPRGDDGEVLRGAAAAALGQSLRGITVRLSAELGRNRLPAGDVVAMTAGGIVELDRAVEDPIDICVNGALFARGRLVLAPGGQWAVRIDDVCAPTPLQPEG